MHNVRSWPVRQWECDLVVALPAVLAELVLKALIAESVAWSSSRGEGVSRTASSSCSASIAFCSRLV